MLLQKVIIDRGTYRYQVLLNGAHAVEVCKSVPQGVGSVCTLIWSHGSTMTPEAQTAIQHAMSKMHYR
jgi:hypothetical protein